MNGKADNNYYIPDTQVKQALDNVNKKLNELSKTPVEHFAKEIKKGDTGKVVQGKLYSDELNNAGKEKRMVVNISGKLYYVGLTKMESGGISGTDFTNEGENRIYDLGDSSTDYGDYIVEEGNFDNYVLVEGEF